MSGSYRYDHSVPEFFAQWCAVVAECGGVSSSCCTGCVIYANLKTTPGKTTNKTEHETTLPRDGLFKQPYCTRSFSVILIKVGIKVTDKIIVKFPNVFYTRVLYIQNHTRI